MNDGYKTSAIPSSHNNSISCNEINIPTLPSTSETVDRFSSTFQVRKSQSFNFFRYLYHFQPSLSSLFHGYKVSLGACGMAGPWVRGRKRPASERPDIPRKRPQNKNPDESSRADISVRTEDRQTTLLGSGQEVAITMEISNSDTGTFVNHKALPEKV